MPQRTFNADNNQVALLFQSGTYATASGTGQWPGLVQTHEVDEDMGVIESRYTANSSRNVGQFIDGPQGYTGTITTFPQEWQLLRFALGANVDAGSPSPYTHAITEVNNENVDREIGEAFPSFSLEDSHADWIAGSGVNFVRTIRGCMIDSLTLSLSEGEPASIEASYVAQSVAFSSGAVTAVTVDTVRPFMWQDFVVHIPSGTAIPTLKEASITVSNNLSAPHYVNGSRVIGVPIPGNREYEVTLTTNADPAQTKAFYDQYLLGGSTFNMMVLGTASTGSRVLSWIFSGCKLVDFSAPTPGEGINEQTLTIHPQTSNVAVDSTTEKYNAW